MEMMDDFDPDDVEFDEEVDLEEPGKRPFRKIVGFLGGILILSLIAWVVYSWVVLPRIQIAQNERNAEFFAENTEIALANAVTTEVKSLASTVQTASTQVPNPAESILSDTDTPISDKSAAIKDPRTATVAALLTKNVTAENPTSSPADVLPDTGFGDNVGITEMVVIAAALILIIFFARRFRSAA